MSWIATVHAQSAGKYGMVYYDAQSDDAARKHAEACWFLLATRNGYLDVWVWDDKPGAPDVKKYFATRDEDTNKIVVRL